MHRTFAISRKLHYLNRLKYASNVIFQMGKLLSSVQVITAEMSILLCPHNKILFVCDVTVFATSVILMYQYYALQHSTSNADYLQRYLDAKIAGRTISDWLARHRTGPASQSPIIRHAIFRD